MRIAFGIVAVLVGVAALAFGAVESWASALMKDCPASEMLPIAPPLPGS